MKPMMRDLKASLKPMIKQALISSGEIVGSRLGVGSAGGDIAKRISRLIGSGDYESNSVATNSLIKGSGLEATSQFGQSSLKIRVKHREFLGDVVTGAVAGAFTNYTYPINAGLRTVFPYLSQLASNYEEYCFKGLVFEFISTASPFLSTSALGAAIAAMEYNSSSPAFTSKFAMENSSMAVSTRLDKNLMYGVECAAGSNAQNCYFIRSGTSSLPLTTTDLGLFQFAIAPGAGVPTSSVVGELWVAYDVELDRPFLNMDDIGNCHVYRSGVSNTSPLGTTTTFSRSNGSLSSTTVTATTISPVSVSVGDSLLITIQWVGSSTTIVFPTTPSLSGCSYQNLLLGNTAAVATSPQGSLAGVTYATYTLTVLCSSTTPVITIPIASLSLPGSATCEIIVANLGNNLNVGVEW